MFDRIRSWRHRRYISTLVRAGLNLGNNVYLNDGFFIDPSHCELITIGDNVVFGPGVCILAHDASTKMVVEATRVKPVVLKEGCFIGARAVILPGSIIGRQSIIAAGAVVAANVPDGELWAGVPARRLMSIKEFQQKLLEESSIEISFVSFLNDNEARLRFRDRLIESGMVGLIR